jgi:hypothetical protein
MGRGESPRPELAQRARLYQSRPLVLKHPMLQTPSATLGSGLEPLFL